MIIGFRPQTLISIVKYAAYFCHELHKKMLYSTHCTAFDGIPDSLYQNNDSTFEGDSCDSIISILLAW